MEWGVVAQDEGAAAGVRGMRELGGSRRECGRENEGAWQCTGRVLIVNCRVTWSISQNYSRMKDKPDYKDHRVRGGNPCLEQSLESMELCCLVETFPTKHDDFQVCCSGAPVGTLILRRAMSVLIMEQGKLFPL